MQPVVAHIHFYSSFPLIFHSSPPTRSALEISIFLPRRSSCPTLFLVHIQSFPHFPRPFFDFVLFCHFTLLFTSSSLTHTHTSFLHLFLPTYTNLVHSRPQTPFLSPADSLQRSSDCSIPNPTFCPPTTHSFEAPFGLSAPLLCLTSSFFYPTTL